MYSSQVNKRLGFDKGIWSQLYSLRKRLKTRREVDLKREEVLDSVNLHLTCLHPLTGERLPVFVADYVLEDYGTGMVMGVPAHDARDSRLAQKYGLDAGPIVVEKDSISQLWKVHRNEGAAVQGVFRAPSRSAA
jgi:leucyl-tRNA synthetase